MYHMHSQYPFHCVSLPSFVLVNHSSAFMVSSVLTRLIVFAVAGLNCEDRTVVTNTID